MPPASISAAVPRSGCDATNKKGTIKAIKGLISAYGIPSTILRVKEYGGPDLPDNATPLFEIARKFTKALDFKNNQYLSLNKDSNSYNMIGSNDTYIQAYKNKIKNFINENNPKTSAGINMTFGWRK